MGFCEENSIECDACFADVNGGYKLEVFVRGLTDKEIHERALNDILAKSEAPELPTENPKDWFDPPFFTKQMPFNECSSAFYSLLAYLINNCADSLFTCESTILPVLLENGKYRIYCINHLNNYKKYDVMCKSGIKAVECSGKFPVMPPRFVFPAGVNENKFDGAAAENMKIGMTYDGIPYGFVAKLPPLGISVFDVTLL